MQRSIIWMGLAYDIEEHCAVNYLDKGIRVRSEIEGWAGNVAVYVEYILTLDLSYKVLEFDIDFHVKDVGYGYRMRCNDGRWQDIAGKEFPEFDGCNYIDISLTPMTNTLPVNGIGLNIGDSREIDVLYIDVLKNEVRRDRQLYTRTDALKYGFENDGGKFKAVIDVDNAGFVTYYPALFKMLKPK